MYEEIDEVVVEGDVNALLSVASGASRWQDTRLPARWTGRKNAYNRVRTTVPIVFWSALGLTLVARFIRQHYEHRRGKVHITYPNGRQIVVPLGLSVLEASRLEALNKAYQGPLIISEQVAQRAGIDVSDYPAHLLTVRNRTEPLTIRVIDAVPQIAARVRPLLSL